MGEEYRRYASCHCNYSKPRTMKQIKADYNNMLNKHSLSKVKKR